MEKIDFGPGISMPLKPDKRKRAEEFLSEILGCRETLRNDNYTCYQFPNGQILGITPDDNAPTEEEYENSVWLELISDDFEATKKRITNFGVREVTGGMPDAFFFNLPGGVVFRLVSKDK